MKPGKLLCCMFLLAFLALTVYKATIDFEMCWSNWTNKNAPVKIFNRSVNVQTKDCAQSRPFQHKLLHHCFHGKVS